MIQPIGCFVKCNTVQIRNLFNITKNIAFFYLFCILILKGNIWYTFINNKMNYLISKIFGGIL